MRNRFKGGDIEDSAAIVQGRAALKSAFGEISLSGSFDC